MKGFFLVMCVVGLLASCGDNSKACGPGTIDVDGTCKPDACGPGTKQDGTGICVPDGSVVCVNGTIFDMATGHCVIDPAACQDGTVLVNGACVDPGHVTADIEEAPEPNGRGLLGETSTSPAGTITLKAVGGPGFVIHGHIKPFVDNDGDGQNDGDVDTYELTVTAPTLLHVTADGLHGLAAGFLSVAEVSSTDPLFRWQRLGINLTGDTSKRQLFLPRAGTYAIAIADTRTLFLQSAAGNDQTEYYVTIDALAMPTPATMDLNLGVVGSVTENVRFYSAGQLGTGFSQIDLDMPLSQTKSSIVVLNQGTFRTFGDESTLAGLFEIPAEVIFGDIRAGDQTTIVVDFVYNYAGEPADFTLAGVTTNAKALSTTGTAVSDTVRNDHFTAIKDTNQYYFDVATADQTVALRWNTNIEFDGKLVDANNTFVADFSTSSGSFSGNRTFTDFNGLVRFRHAGRYYVVGIADGLLDTGMLDISGNPILIPANTPGDPMTVTTTIAPVTVPAVTMGTPATLPIAAYPTPDQPQNNATPLTYGPGTEPWQTFNVVGTSTGQTTLALIPTTSAYGRLTSVARHNPPDQVQPPVRVVLGAVNPTYTFTFPQAGAPKSRLINDVLNATSTTYYGLVSAATSAGASTAVTIAARTNPDGSAYTNLGTLAAGTTNRPTETLTTAAPSKLYFFKTTPGQLVTIRLSGMPITMRGTIETLSTTEVVTRSATETVAAANGTVQLVYEQQPTGSTTFTAFRISSAIAIATTQTFALDVIIAPPKVYTATTTATVFADACSGGTVRPFPTPGNSDEGLTAVINFPAALDAFQYFGAPALDFDGDGHPDFVVSSNGWLAMDAANAFDPQFSNDPIPTRFDPGVVAPYWDDLDNTHICTKATGTKFIVQWTGELYAPITQTPPKVQVQAIFDASDNSIEFVYGPNQTAHGDSATVGVGNISGLSGTQVSKDTAGSVAASTSKKLTPN